MDESTMKRRLTVALSNLIVDDWRLLTLRTATTDAPVSERSIAFALGWHLKSVMESGWDVDCEYNRRGSDDAVQHKRRLARRAGAGDAAEPPVVFPDLIVHRRRMDGRVNNLLVLEFKTNDDTQSHVGGSVQSILEIQQQFAYRHAVFLDLRLSTGRGIDPRWTWFSAAKPGSTELRAVYKRAALNALVQRGEEAEDRRYR